jgi:hypothetical protein
MSSLWKMGFGAVNTRALVRLNHTIWAPENSTLNFVLLANLPQLVLSAAVFHSQWALNDDVYQR